MSGRGGSGVVGGGGRKDCEVGSTVFRVTLKGDWGDGGGDVGEGGGSGVNGRGGSGVDCRNDGEGSVVDGPVCGGSGVDGGGGGKVCEVGSTVFRVTLKGDWGDGGVDGGNAGGSGVNGRGGGEVDGGNDGEWSVVACTVCRGMSTKG